VKRLQPEKAPDALASLRQLKLCVRSAERLIVRVRETSAIVRHPKGTDWFSRSSAIESHLLRLGSLDEHLNFAESNRPLLFNRMNGVDDCLEEGQQRVRM